MSRLTVYGAFLLPEKCILCGKPATITHGHAPAVSLDTLQSSGGSFAYWGIKMSAKNGQPCKKCGSHEWNKRGDCVFCKKEARRNYRKSHPEKRRLEKRKFRERHAESERARKRKYKRNGSSSVRANKTSKKAEWNTLLKRYEYKCLCCGRSDVQLTVDHIIPLSKGGTSSADNLQPLCMNCNVRKGVRIIDYRPDTGAAAWTLLYLFENREVRR